VKLYVYQVDASFRAIFPFREIMAELSTVTIQKCKNLNTQFLLTISFPKYISPIYEGFSRMKSRRRAKPLRHVITTKRRTAAKPSRACPTTRAREMGSLREAQGKRVLAQELSGIF
jgi:hypothetical protein